MKQLNDESMKPKIIAAIMLFAGFVQIANGQVTEAEKTLRTQSADTLMGWKTGGVVTFTLSQTSLTNWVAGARILSQ